jgi:transketolase
MNDAKSRTGKGNQFVSYYTEMGNGVDFMMHTHAWYGKPNDAQPENALAQNQSTLSDYQKVIRYRN